MAPDDANFWSWCTDSKYEVRVYVTHIENLNTRIYRVLSGSSLRIAKEIVSIFTTENIDIYNDIMSDYPDNHYYAEIIRLKDKRIIWSKEL